MAKFNPFRPNGMAHPGMFSGRWDELRAIEQSLVQTKHGNPKHFLVCGERGIGKSSLLMYVDVVASGNLSTIDDERLNFLVLSIELVGSSTYEDIVAAIANQLKSEISNHRRVKEFAAKTWEFITNWKIMGVEYKKESSNSGADAILIDALCDGISTFFREAGATIDGLLITIDEADRPAEDARLGEFCKIFTEKMTKRRCEKVCLGLAGLPFLVSKLRASHESAPRLFEVLSLDPLERAECEDVIRKGLAEAELVNKTRTEIDNRALEAIIDLSEGYPHFIQQFAYSAFDQDEDNRITIDDVTDAAFKENGALDQLGKRYFAELYFERIASEDYRKVLNAMAEHLDGWISRAQIIKNSGVKETQVTNALKALRDREIILVNDQKQGEYRLPTKSFAVWIKALTTKRTFQRDLGQASAD
jgi:hypothetical protein